MSSVLWSVDTRDWADRDNISYARAPSAMRAPVQLSYSTTSTDVGDAKACAFLMRYQARTSHSWQLIRSLASSQDNHFSAKIKSLLPHNVAPIYRAHNSAVLINECGARRRITPINRITIKRRILRDPISTVYWLFGDANLFVMSYAPSGRYSLATLRPSIYVTSLPGFLSAIDMLCINRVFFPSNSAAQYTKICVYRVAENGGVHSSQGHISLKPPRFETLIISLKRRTKNEPRLAVP